MISVNSFFYCKKMFTHVIWERAFQKLKVKLDLLTDLDMLLMVQKRIINGICHAVYRYVEFKKHIKKYYEKKQ